MQTYDVYRVMSECRNFFETGYVRSSFSIQGGAINPSTLFPAGSYIAIVDSAFHNGVFHLQSDGVLEGVPPGVFDEAFTGKVYFLRPPIGFLALCEEIAKFIEKTPVSSFQSESMGEYSYTLASGKNGGVMTWQERFEDSLAQYRHMYTEVEC